MEGITERPKKSLSRLVRLAIFIGGFIILFLILRLFGIVNWFQIESSGNYPNINAYDYVWTTNLNSPERFDYVCFENEEFGYKSIWIYRLCGLPGEQVEIKNGTFYLNGENMDEGLNLSHSYYCTGGRAIELYENIVLGGDGTTGFFRDPNSDTLVLTLTEEMRTEYPDLKRYNPVSALEIKEQWARSWTPNDFGPVIVPSGYCFLLGDNRENSRDSRYIGFVSMDAIVGVVLNK